MVSSKLQLAAVVLFSALVAVTAKNVVCYYGSWATYRTFPAAYNVENIDPSLCTHLIYAFAGLDTSTGKIMSLDPYNDLEENFGKGSYKKFTALHEFGPETYLAVGGWNEGSQKYSQMAATPIGRQTFASSVVEFLQTYGFQGLDLDWEYPGLRDGHPDDRANYVLLLKELATQLHAANLKLSVAVGASWDMVDTSYDVSGISQNVDMINLMSYDYHTGASDNFTGHNSPVLPRPNDGVPLNVEYSVNLWLDAGASPAKLHVAIPMYGRSFTLKDSSNTGVGAPVTGPGVAGVFTKEDGFLSYYEICTSTGWQKVYDDKEVYAYKGDQWVSYEDTTTIQKKLQYYNSNFANLGGVMIWALESDDFLPQCGGAKHTLLAAINQGLRQLP